MLIQLRSSAPRNAASSMMTIGNPPKARASWEQALRVGLALYLLPALLAVLFVGAVGMLLLVVGRRFTDVVGCQACHPRTSVGQEVFRA